MSQETKAVRDEVRARLFASRPLRTKTIKIRDVEVEIHQPTIGDVLSMKENASQVDSLMQVLLDYCFIPGTNTKVFEAADKDTILGWGIDDWFSQVSEAVQELTNLSVADAEKN